MALTRPCSAQAFPSLLQHTDSTGHTHLACSDRLCLVAGTFLGQIEGTSVTSHGLGDVFVAAFSKEGGSPLWLATGGSAGDDHAIDVRPDADGGAILTALLGNGARFPGLPAVDCTGPGMCETHITIDRSGRFLQATPSGSQRFENINARVTESSSIILSAADLGAGPGRIGQRTVIGARSPIALPEQSTARKAAAPAISRCTVFPNPTQGPELHVLIRGLEGPASEKVSIELLDLRGTSLLSHQAAMGSALGLHSIALPSVAAGTYPLLVTDTHGARVCNVNIVIP
jgi:hypothetical protein